MAVPIIAISLEDDTDDNNEYLPNGYMSLAEALTDIESLDSDGEQPSRKRKSPLIFKGVGGDGIILTDSEYIDGSGDEDDYRPRSPTPLDNVIDLGGTFEDILQVSSEMTSRGADMSKVTSKSTNHGFLGLPDDHREGLTDYEDFALSDDDWIEEEMHLDDINLDDHIPDDGVVDISDRVKQASNDVSPAATPEPGAMRKDEGIERLLAAKPKQGKAKKQANRKAAQAKKKTKSQFLSPKPDAPVNDLTDTEVLKSDSDDEERGKRTIRRRKKNQNKNAEGGVTDVEDLDMSDYEGSSIKDVDHIPGLPKVTRSEVHISRGRLAPYMGPDTDAEDMDLSDREDANPVPARQVRYKPKYSSFGLSVPVADPGALTDVEDLGMEMSSDEDSPPRAPSPLARPLEEMEAHYGSITVSYSTKERAKNSNQQESDHGITDHEDFTADDAEDQLLVTKRKRAVMKNMKKSRQFSTDDDDVEGSDGDFRRGDRGDDVRVSQDMFEIKFMEVDGEARPILVKPGGKTEKETSRPGVLLAIPPPEGGLTDVEDVGRSSDSSDSDNEQARSFLMVQPRRRGSITDVEDFEDDADDKSSVESDGGTEHALPEVVRELTLVHYQHDGRPVVVTLPLSDDHPVGLMAMRDDTTHAVTDVEDLTADEQDTVAEDDARPSSPEIEMDFGIIDESEAMKVEKKLRVLSVSHAPLTDTEDLYFDGEPTRRKKTKKPKSLFVKHVERSGATDVEELEVSDAEAYAAEGIAVVRRPLASLIPAGSRQNDKTDVEDVSADDDDDDDDDDDARTPRTKRSMSITPDIMKHMDYSTTTFKEGNGPFPKEMRRLSLDHSQIIPTIRMTSPSPLPGTQQTDSEDMQTSADEEPPSRSDTTTPFALDDFPSTVVHMKHSRKLDYDAPEEAANIKGYENIRDAHTDVEEVSEDERQGEGGAGVGDRMHVEETHESVCVCVSGEPAVCVCVGKRRGDLTMVWKNGNSTTSATAARNVTQEWTGKSDSAKESTLSDGDGPTQGAAGGVSVTTTETRVVEVSGDQQELLEKLAAERHQ